MNPLLYLHPWQGSKNPTPKDLQSGVWSSNGYAHLHVPVKTGFETAQQRLREAGVELVDSKGPDISDMWNLQKNVQNSSFLCKCLSKEPCTEIVKATGIIDPKDKRPELNMEYLHSLNVRISTLVRQMHAAWSPDGKPIDALLWVTAPHSYSCAI